MKVSAAGCDARWLGRFVLRPDERGISWSPNERSLLDRQPLLDTGSEIIVALPSALGAAVREAVIEACVQIRNELQVRAAVLRSQTDALRQNRQSNLVRIAAASARRLGMEIHIQLENRVADGGETYRTSGNLLLDRMLGATLHPLPEGEDEAAADAAMEAPGGEAGGRGPNALRRPLRPRAPAARRARLRAGRRRDRGAGPRHRLRCRGLRLGQRAHPCRNAGRPAGAGRAGAGARHLRAPRCGEPSRPGGAGGLCTGGDDRAARMRSMWATSTSPTRCSRRATGGSTSPRARRWRWRRATRGCCSTRSGRADRACPLGADRGGQPGAVRPHRRPAGALRLCRDPGAMALGSAGRTGELTGEHGGCAGRARHRVRGGWGSRGPRAAAARPRAGSSSETPAVRAAAARRRW